MNAGVRKGERRKAEESSLPIIRTRLGRGFAAGSYVGVYLSSEAARDELVSACIISIWSNYNGNANECFSSVESKRTTQCFYLQQSRVTGKLLSERKGYAFGQFGASIQAECASHESATQNGVDQFSVSPRLEKQATKKARAIRTDPAVARKFQKKRRGFARETRVYRYRSFSHRMEIKLGSHRIPDLERFVLNYLCSTKRTNCREREREREQERGKGWRGHSGFAARIRF